MSASERECPICITTVSKSNWVSCPYCEFSTCKKCQCKYVLDNDKDSHCMSCSRAWDRDVQFEIYNKTFVNKELKNHRENILMDRERSLLPATQPAVEQEMRRLKAVKTMDNLREEYRIARQRLNDIRHEMWRTQRIIYRGEETMPDSNKTFLHKCPNEGCRGFLSTAWKCGICKMYTCPECNEVKGDNRDAPHECSPENVETMRMIRKECKNCPGCGTSIFRVHGCDQMWCTKCHTPFSWRTGLLITNGAIHNPHFYAYQQQNGAANEIHANNQCGMVTNHRLMTELSKHRSVAQIARVLMTIHRIVIHTEQVELPRYPMNHNERQNTDLRVRYMMNKITDEAWKKELQKREKSQMKKRDFGMLLRMFVDASTDIFRRLVETHENERDLPAIYTELNELRKYVNKEMIVLHGRYGCVSMTLSESWAWHRYPVVKRKSTDTS